MPQISIKLDASTLKTLETVAAKRHTSVSNWIKERIHVGLKQEWPENYFSLFGILDEDDLSEPAKIPFEYNSHREQL
jgi:hypothetical protein